MPIVHGEELRENHLLTWDRVNVVNSDPQIQGRAVASIHLEVNAGEVSVLNVTYYRDRREGDDPNSVPLEIFQYYVKRIHIETRSILGASYLTNEGSTSCILNEEKPYKEMKFLE